MGYASDRNERRDGSGVRSYGLREDLNVDSILTLDSANGTVWVNGSKGVSFFTRGRFRSLLLRQSEFTQGVSGVLFDDAGDLWLNGSAGVVMVSAAEVAKSTADPRHLANSTLYGEADGIAGSPAEVKPLPSALKDGAGRLWFATAGSLVYLPSGAILHRRTPPTVGVVDVFVNGISVSPDLVDKQPIVLQGGGVSRLEFDYVAADLSTPLQIQYRYMLEGEDTWQAVGSRRQAFYERLRPGEYRFRVAVSNGGDQWME